MPSLQLPPPPDVETYRDRWQAKRERLLDSLKDLQAQVDPDPAAVAALQTEIADFEKLPRPGAAGEPEAPKRRRRQPRIFKEHSPARPCLLGRCDGCGWELTGEEARPCDCRELRRERKRKAKVRAVVGRDLALSMNSAPITNLAQDSRARLGRYLDEFESMLADGTGLWLCGEAEMASVASRLIAAESVRRGLGTRYYHRHELQAHLRGLARHEGPGAIGREIYGPLTDVTLLVLDGFDAIVSKRDEPVDVAGRAAGSQTLLSAGYRDLDIADVTAVIESRWREQKATVVSTRIAPEELRRQLPCLGRFDLLRSLLRAIGSGQVSAAQDALAEFDAERLVARLLEASDSGAPVTMTSASL